MATRREDASPPRRQVSHEGFTLVELMVAAFLLIVVIFGLAQTYTRGRSHLDYEEDRRKATAVAQTRLDALRRDFRYDGLTALADTDTTYTMDNRSYLVSHQIATATPETNSSEVTITVHWTARTPSGLVDRTLEHTTTLARSLP